jgi:hypothetical protein
MASTGKKGKKIAKATPKVGAVKGQVTRSVSPMSPIDIGARIITHLRGGGSRREIPFLLPDIRKKTQIVEVRLTSDFIAITTVAATAYTTVVPIIHSSFTNQVDLINVFEEVRPVRGKVYYVPRFSMVGVNGAASLRDIGGAVVDFANNAALVSTATLLDHDNVVTFPLFSSSDRQKNIGRFPQATAQWSVLPDWLPSEAWEDTSSVSAFAWWKPYFAVADVTTSGTVGYAILEMDFQYRGVK